MLERVHLGSLSIDGHSLFLEKFKKIKKYIIPPFPRHYHPKVPPQRKGARGGPETRNDSNTRHHRLAFRTDLVLRIGPSWPPLVVAAYVLVRHVPTPNPHRLLRALWSNPNRSWTSSFCGIIQHHFVERKKERHGMCEMKKQECKLGGL